MSIYLKNIHTLVTMDDDRRVLNNVTVQIEGNIIKEIHENPVDIPRNAKVIDCSSMAVMPGLVNTHHHFYQTMTRNIPEVQNAELFDWLIFLYEIWKNLDHDSLHVSSQIAAVELILSGCTTALDHSYVYPNNDSSLYETEKNAVAETGLRFHLCRGSMSLSKKDGGLPPDTVVQCDEEIFRHSEEIIQKFHDSSKGSMFQVVIAPCSPFSVTPEIMRDTIKLGQKYNVHCHTHLAETKDEENFCIEKFGKRPFDYIEELGWMTENTSFAHSIWLNQNEVERMAKAGAGVAHCPVSNMRLGSGIAPIVDMLKAGVKVGLAVDGSASNDSSHMLAEMRQALLLQRIRYGTKAFTADDALYIATRGGAEAFGRKDIGYIAPDMVADLIGINIDTIDFAGAHHDIKAALVFCSPQKVSFSIINGREIVRDGVFLPFDIKTLVEKQNKNASTLYSKKHIK